MLTERVRAVHAESDPNCGMPRLRAELIDQGVMVSRRRVAQLICAANIRNVSRRRAFVVTTRQDKDRWPAPDLADRDFKVEAANYLWLAYMIYVPARARFIYLAVVLGEQMTAEPVLSAMNVVMQQRKLEVVINHS